MTDPNPPCVVTVFMTTPSLETAETLGRTLVSERLAACANVLPGVVSIFHWNGELQRETEAMVILKTSEGCVSALEERAMSLHPYDVPEFLVVPVVGWHAPYLAWIAGEVGL